MYFSIEDTAKELGRSIKTIRNQAAAGKIPKAKKKDGKWKIPKAWVVDARRRQERRNAK